jgi:probable HAF family extracellular repeat protein
LGARSAIFRSGGTSDALGINAEGVVVGWTTVDTDTTAHAAVFRNGTIKDLGTLSSMGSIATAINDSGRVVGYSVVNPRDAHAFVYDLPDGPMRDVSAGNICLLRAVNSAGDAVGTCSPREDAKADVYRASIWRGGVWAHLDELVLDPSWTLYDAVAINDRGQITGTGHHDNQFRAYLLTPR